MLTEVGAPHQGASVLAAPRSAAGRRVRLVIGALGWVVVILAVCLAALWLWSAGQPAVAWAVAVTAFVVVPAALAGAAAARRDLRRPRPIGQTPGMERDASDTLVAAVDRLDSAEHPSSLLATRLPGGAPGVACTGRSGAVLAIWDEDGRLVHEHPQLAAVAPRAG